MKAIRYITAMLLLAAGVGHVILFIQDPHIQSSAAVLFFGIIYLVLGTVFLFETKYSPVLGIIFPLAGVVYGVIAFNPANAPLLLNILGILDVIMIILCSVLVWGRKKKAL